MNEINPNFEHKIITISIDTCIRNRETFIIRPYLKSYENKSWLHRRTQNT